MTCSPFNITKIAELNERGGIDSEVGYHQLTYLIDEQFVCSESNYNMSITPWMIKLRLIWTATGYLLTWEGRLNYEGECVVCTYIRAMFILGFHWFFF